MARAGAVLGVAALLLWAVLLVQAARSGEARVIVAAAVFGRRLRKVSTEFQDRVAEANAGAEESITAVRVVKWFSAEDVASRRSINASAR